MAELRKKLQLKHLYLMENLDLDNGLLDWLYQEKILTAYQLILLSEEETAKKRIRLLLAQELPFSENAYSRFIEGLKCNGQKHVADELEKSTPTEDETDTHAEVGQDELKRDCVIGFVHQVLQKTRTKSGQYYLTFHLQRGPDYYERCCTLVPDWHQGVLKTYQENRQPVNIARFKYRNPSEGYDEPPTIIIDERSYILPVVSEDDVDFAYKEMPIVYTSLDEISKLNHGEFINIRVRVTSQGNRETKVTKRKWKEDSCGYETIREKCVADENGHTALLVAGTDFAYSTILDPGERFVEIRNVSVVEFQNNKHLATNTNTTVEVEQSN